MAFSLTENATVIQIMNSLLPPGSGIIYKDPNFSGDPRCAALFSGGWNATEGNSTIALFPDFGFLLGTGDAHKLYGQDGTDISTNFGYPGDPDIAINAGTSSSHDACTLAFEFQCENSNLGFLEISYAFASDEYIEQVNENTGFSDEFALLLNGNNIGDVPGSPGTAVSVYSINDKVNPEYFVYNNPRMGLAPYPDFEPDGFTKNLKATGNILPGWNTMKIGIVDILDPHYDSWVFLEGGAFMCVPIPVATPAPTSSPTPAPTTSNNIPGNAGGDPHFRTFGNELFSYHGQCDMVLSRSNGFASGLGLEVHIRTTRVNSPHVDYSYISGVAVRIGSDVLEVTEDGALIVNGESVILDDGSDTSFAGYALKMVVKGSKKRIIAHNLDIGNGNSIQIRSNTKTGMLFVDMNGAFADSEGLLGAAPEETKPLLARDGITDLTGHWNTYGEEWQVNDVDPKLFKDGNRRPQYPDGCVYKADMKQQVRRRRLFETTKEVTFEAATDACAHVKKDEMKEFCVNDILATGDLDLAEDSFYAN